MKDLFYNKKLVMLNPDFLKLSFATQANAVGWLSTGYSYEGSLVMIHHPIVESDEYNEGIVVGSAFGKRVVEDIINGWESRYTLTDDILDLQGPVEVIDNRETYVIDIPTQDKKPFTMFFEVPKPIYTKINDFVMLNWLGSPRNYMDLLNNEQKRAETVGEKRFYERKFGTDLQLQTPFINWVTTKFVEWKWCGHNDYEAYAAGWVGNIRIDTYKCGECGMMCDVKQYLDEEAFKQMNQEEYKFYDFGEWKGNIPYKFVSYKSNKDGDFLKIPIVDEKYEHYFDAESIENSETISDIGARVMDKAIYSAKVQAIISQKMKIKELQRKMEEVKQLQKELLLSSWDYPNVLIL